VYLIRCYPKFIILAVDSKSIIISIKKKEGNRRERRYTSSQCPELQILDSTDLINYPRAPLNSSWFNREVTSERSSSGREGSLRRYHDYQVAVRRVEKSPCTDRDS